VIGVPGGGARDVIAEAIRRHVLAELAKGLGPRASELGPEGVISGDLAHVAERLRVEPKIATVVAAARTAPAPVILWLSDERALAAASAALDPDDDQAEARGPRPD